VRSDYTVIHSSTISLVIKVICNDILEGQGEVGEDSRATGCDVIADCLGVDVAGKLFNVEIRIGKATYEEALKITEELSCDSMHHIQGIFFLDSDEKYDIITIFDPSYEPVSNGEEAFYADLFITCSHKKGEYLYRSMAKNLAELKLTICCK